VDLSLPKKPTLTSQTRLCISGQPDDIWNIHPRAGSD
jgi:hypothetical protein